MPFFKMLCETLVDFFVMYAKQQRGESPPRFCARANNTDFSRRSRISQREVSHPAFYIVVEQKLNTCKNTKNSTKKADQPSLKWKSAIMGNKAIKTGVAEGRPRY